MIPHVISSLITRNDIIWCTCTMTINLPISTNYQGNCEITHHVTNPLHHQLYSCFQTTKDVRPC